MIEYLKNYLCSESKKLESYRRLVKDMQRGKVL